MKFFKVAAGSVGFAVIVVAFSFMLNHAWDGQEVVDCDTLVSQSQNIAASVFYITQWQKDMCDSHHIAINARVK